MSPVQSATHAVYLRQGRQRAVATIHWKLLLLIWAAVADSPQSLRAEGPRIFLLDGAQLQSARERIASGDAQFEPALQSLRARRESGV